jgi:hypothetical protein
MNARRTVSDGDTPCPRDYLKSERQELAQTFFRFLDSAKPRQNCPGDASDAQEKINGFTDGDHLLSALQHRSEQLKVADHWGSRDLVCQEMRDRALRKTWLIEKLDGKRIVADDTAIVCSTAVTDEFKNRVRIFLKRIPANLREIVRKNGCEVLVVGNLSEVDPDLASQSAQRHPDGEVVGNLPAFYEPRLNAIVFAEKPDLAAREQETTGRFNRTRKFLEQLGICFYGELAPKSYASLAQCGAHEFGRALDKAMSNFSSSFEFEHAFQQDLAKISEKEKNTLWYYTAPNAPRADQQCGHQSAKEELFAELFAVNQGLGAAHPEVDELLIKKFPAVNRLICSKLA